MGRFRGEIAWVVGALLVVLAVVLFLLLSCPEENTLPQVYDVL